MEIAMKIISLGAGPSGLYFAICMKLANADNDVSVYERNKPATFKPPWYSLIGDFAMFRDILLGRISL